MTLSTFYRCRRGGSVFEKMGGSVKDVKSTAEVEEVIKSGAPVILHFWASWCEASKHTDEVFCHLSTDFPTAHFLRVEVEEKPEISETYAVSAVPFFAFIKDGKTVDTLEGADPSSLANKVAKVVLFGGCRIHGDIEVAEEAAKHVMELKPEDGGVYSILASVYANVERWEDVVNVRR